MADLQAHIWTAVLLSCLLIIIGVIVALAWYVPMVLSVLAAMLVLALIYIQIYLFVR